MELHREFTAAPNLPLAHTIKNPTRPDPNTNHHHSGGPLTNAVISPAILLSSLRRHHLRLARARFRVRSQGTLTLYDHTIHDLHM